jgi:hypothetical protein
MIRRGPVKEPMPLPFGEYQTSQIEHALQESLRLIHIYTDLLCTEIEAAKYVGIYTIDRDLIKAALIKSVTLQSELAGLLNSRDAGARMQFTAEEWLQRLRVMRGLSAEAESK